MPQAKPRFDGTIQLGHIIQSAVIIIGVVGAWFNTQTRLEQHERDLARHDQEIRQLHQDDSTIRDTQSKLSETMARVTALIEERTHRIP